VRGARRWLLSAGYVGVLALATLIASEVLFRLLAAVAPAGSGLDRVRVFTLGPVNFGECDEVAWKRQFLRTTSRQFGFGSMLVPHPTRGWSPRPNHREVVQGKRYSINDAGARADSAWRPDAGRYPILVVGDSFTFGSDADDADTWPSRLQSLDRRLHVINLAAPGYGVDQMYITAHEEIRTYRPRLVILAFIEDDLLRATLRFREFKKPRFELVGVRLVLTNTPIGSIDDVYREVHGELGDDRPSPLRTVELGRNLYRALRIRYRCLWPSARLNRRIIEETRETAGEMGADFLLVYLASNLEIQDPGYASAGEEFFRRFVIEHRVEALNTRPDFLRQLGRYAFGHYHAAEADLVSRLVYARITRLRSWQSFAAAPTS